MTFSYINTHKYDNMHRNEIIYALICINNHVLSCLISMLLTRRNREVVNFKRYRVKNNTELANLMKMYRIQGYNGKYGSNPQGILEFSRDLSEFGQIGREIDGTNWGK